MCICCLFSIGLRNNRINRIERPCPRFLRIERWRSARLWITLRISAEPVGDKDCYLPNAFFYPESILWTYTRYSGFIQPVNS
jgi:hypothetical protein